MKRLAKSMYGVTLLEVMLVLAVAAMIIVMSVRYYQSASSNQQANSALQQIQGITAAADNLAQGTGSYSGGGVSSTTLAPLLPGGTASAFTTPWGTTISIGSVGASSYTVTLPGTPSGVCPLIGSKLGQNNHYTNVSSCSSSGTTNFSYTYLANP